MSKSVVRLRHAAILLFVFAHAHALQDNSHVDVLIVGAGASGMAAATTLAHNGIDVLIIEAEPRWGGRVNSIPFGDAIVDLGAEWCHGENLIYDRVQNLDILVPSSFADRLYASNPYLEDEFLDEVIGIFKEMYDIAHIARAAPEGISFGRFFIERYHERINELYGHNMTRWQFALEALNTFKGYILTDLGSFSWFGASAASDMEMSPGNYLLSWNGKGYKTFLRELIKGFNLDQHLMLNTEVKQITHDPSKDLVKVQLNTGRILKANHVIFTPSLGVLKHNHESLFQPPLANHKTQAIQALGMDAVIKVMVHYKNPWWDNNDNFYFVWTVADKEEFLSQDNLSWLTNFLGAMRVEQNPNVLSCWFTGEFIQKIERLPDRQLVDGITYGFRKMFGHRYNITYPDKIISSKWYSNPHFRGTYSYETIASRKMRPSAAETLSEPITSLGAAPRILFAGEATHPKHFSTVHGAVESGLREAHRIIDWKKLDFIKKLKKYRYLF